MEDHHLIGADSPLEVPFFLELSQMNEALRLRNDEKLWEVARRSTSQDRFFNELRSQVTLTSYQVGSAKRPHRQYCALIMQPLILPAGAATLVGNADSFKGVFGKVRSWLSDWFGDEMEIRIFNAPVGYDEIAVWSPSVMREKLEQLAAWTNPTLEIPPDWDYRMPERASRLAFVVAAVQQPGEYPSLPPMDAGADASLQAKVAGLMEVHRPDRSERAVRALVPGFAADSILDGVLTWLQVLNEEEGIGQWDATPVDQDTVVLQLEVGEERRVSTVPLRAHQIGLEGIEQILKRLQKVCGQMGFRGSDAVPAERPRN